MMEHRRDNDGHERSQPDRQKTSYTPEIPRSWLIDSLGSCHLVAHLLRRNCLSFSHSSG